MASYRERSQTKADELAEKFKGNAKLEARRRTSLAIDADDIMEAFLWLDVWAVLDRRDLW